VSGHRHGGGDKSDHDHRHDHGHEHGRGPLAAVGGESLARGAGRGRLLYLDAPSGLAGDMIVASLVDLGVPEQVLRDALAGFELGSYQLQLERVLRSNIAGLRFVVSVDAVQPSRDYQTIVRMLEAVTTLTAAARSLALRAFEILARAEAQVHACALEAVHFHEVGAVDSIVDIVAAAVAFDYLGAEVQCSPLPLGRGSTRSAHGVIPLPAPATVLCLANVPTYDPGIAAPSSSRRPAHVSSPPSRAALAVGRPSVRSAWAWVPARRSGPIGRICCARCSARRIRTRLGTTAARGGRW
jgi:hypothetical protein